jgi:hypothetical protein
MEKGQAGSLPKQEQISRVHSAVRKELPDSCLLFLLFGWDLSITLTALSEEEL